MVFFFLRSTYRLYIKCLVESRRSLSSKNRLGLLDSVGERELEVRNQKLSNVLSLDIISLLQFNNLEDVNGSESRSVSGSHVLVEGLDSTSSSNVSELLVHVVGTRSRVVSDPDTEVLNLGRSLFVDLANGNNLTSSLLNSSELGQKVPESRLGNNSVRGKDSHSVELGLRIDLARELSSDDLIFLQVTAHCICVSYN